MTGSHTRQTVSHEVRLWIFIRVAKDVRNCTRVGDHKPAASEQSMVDERRTVLLLPSGDEIVVLLVMHGREIPCEE